MIPYAQHASGDHMTPAEVAEWLGTDEATLQAEHDLWHKRLTAFLGIPSLSLAVGNGAVLSATQQRLAELEEDAVLSVCRLHYHAIQNSEV